MKKTTIPYRSIIYGWSNGWLFLFDASRVVNFKHQRPQRPELQRPRRVQPCLSSADEIQPPKVVIDLSSQSKVVSTGYSALRTLRGALGSLQHLNQSLLYTPPHREAIICIAAPREAAEGREHGSQQSSGEKQHDHHTESGLHLLFLCAKSKTKRHNPKKSLQMISRDFKSNN